MGSEMCIRDSSWTVAKAADLILAESSDVLEEQVEFHIFASHSLAESPKLELTMVEAAVVARTELMSYVLRSVSPEGCGVPLRASIHSSHFLHRILSAQRTIAVA